MDVVRSFFKNPSINTPRENSFKTDSPMGAIEEQIKLLENLNLSPLPSTKEAMMMHKNDVSAILKKIIYNFDIILMHKLKKNELSSKNYSEEVHYWNFISKYFQIPSVKFINNIYDKLQTIPNKGLAWIYISISEKSFYESLKEIYHQGFDKKFYENDSFIVKMKFEILSMSDKICKFHLFNVKSGIEDEYNEYKRQKEIEGKDMERSDIDVPLVSPINKKLNSINYLTPYTLDLKDAKNSNYFSKATLDMNSSTFQSKAEGGTEKVTKAMDSLFNMMNMEDDENVDNGNDDDDMELIREKSYAKSTQIIYSNVRGQNNIEYENYNNGDDKIINTLKQIHKQQNNNQTYNVSKYIDIRSCYKDDYYNFNFENKNTSSPKAKLSGGKKESDLNFDYSNTFIPFDKNFRISRKVDKNQFSKKDIIYYKNKEIKMSNSIVFYLNYYYKKEPYIRFNTAISSERPITLASQNYQCQFCRKQFSTFMHIPTSKVYWCSYYMRYICENCASEEFSVIPAFILKNWNFQKFPISKEAKELLTKWFEKPVIHIKQNDPVIKDSSILHTAIVLKRKIHKIFDLMKCDNYDAFVLNTLGAYKHFVLRENLFSLKDLVDIHEFRLIAKLKDFLQQFENHIIKDCSVCCYKGGICMMCLTDEIIFAYDIETVLYCNECKKLFHKKCCSFHPCIINR